MADYKKFLIKQQSYDGSSYTDVSSVIDTQAAYGVVCQECPFKYLPESKEIATRDWHDEQGEDFFIPSDGMKFKAYDMEATFLYVGTESDIKTDLSNFIKFIYGRNTSGSPLLAIYDEYTETGRRGVYVTEVSDDLYFYNDTETDAIAQFKVKFHVSDPVTDITLSL